ncbi:hypothetical protein BJY52DRAFT_919894 [Lactarius psammicola]|nr:hypothetical protein BJY52DRAFT_919894 [Lactarius psammicola]
MMPRGWLARNHKTPPPHLHFSPFPALFPLSLHIVFILMSIAQKSSKRINNVPTLPTRTIRLASAAHRRHSAFTRALHPTILCVIVATASIHFLSSYKHSEATNNTTANLAPLLLTYSSLLFSLFGALSTALRAIPVIGIAFQDQTCTFIKYSAYPSTKVIYRVPMGLDDSHTVQRPFISPWLWLSKGLWDCSFLYAFASVACITAQVWLYICTYEPWCIQAAGGIAVATVCAAVLNHLRTSPIPWTRYYS